MGNSQSINNNNTDNDDDLIIKKKFKIFNEFIETSIKINNKDGIETMIKNNLTNKELYEKIDIFQLIYDNNSTNIIMPIIDDYKNQNIPINIKQIVDIMENCSMELYKELLPISNLNIYLIKEIYERLLKYHYN